MQPSPERRSLRELLTGHLRMPSAFTGLVLDKLDQLKRNSIHSSAGLLGKKPEADEFVQAAFRAKADAIASIAELGRGFVLGRSEQTISESLPNIIRLIERSDEIKSRIKTDPETIAGHVAEKFFGWACFAKYVDQHVIHNTPKDIKSLGAAIFKACGKISPLNLGLDRSRDAALEIFSLLASNVDPTVLLKNCSKAESFRWGIDAFEPASVIHGVTQDFFRTRQFAYGIKAAVEELERRFPNVPGAEPTAIKIADIGSGPLGLLGIIALACSDRVQVEFVEIHPDSCAILKNLIAELGLSHRAKVVKMDAFKWDPKEKFHGILSETMSSGLVVEPFPNLIQSVRKSLIHPGGIVIPEKVVLSLIPLPHNIRPEDMGISAAVINNPLYDRKPFIKLPALAQYEFNSLRTSGENVSFEFPYDDLRPYKYLGLVIGTEIHVFGNHLIRQNESLISGQQGLTKGLIYGSSGEREQIMLTFDPKHAEQDKKLIVEYKLGTNNLDPKFKITN